MLYSTLEALKASLLEATIYPKYLSLYRPSVISILPLVTSLFVTIASLETKLTN
jgi:hypothetical protein